VKKKHPEHVNLERWLVSYADFITLLFAFFVIMYAMSRADMAKVKAVADSMKQAFGGGPIDFKGSSGGNTVNPFETIEAPGGRVMNLPAGKANVGGQDTGLKSVQDELEQSASFDTGVADTAEKLQMHYDSRGLVIRIAAKDFFAPGESKVRTDYRLVLDRIARVLSKSGRLVRVEGHVDQSEVDAGVDPWALSSARAAWVVRYWISRFDFNPKRLAAAGLAHYRPLSGSNGEFSAARNRRVEIIVLNENYETP
jgi:chemotaxis protein MotB